MKIRWCAKAGDVSYEDAFDHPSETAIEEWEIRLFSEIKKLDFQPKYLMLNSKWRDGSGFIRYYERRGEVWVATYSETTYSENMLPNWIPWFFLTACAAAIAVLMLIFWWIG